MATPSGGPFWRVVGQRDRRLAKASGCRLAKWLPPGRVERPCLTLSKWEKSLEETGIDIRAFYTTRAESFRAASWDPIHARVTKPFLISEWEKALQQESTPDCRSGDCQSCGVCDFQIIETRVFAASESQGSETQVDLPIPPLTRCDTLSHFLCQKPDRHGSSGHLELANIMFRAFRRAKIPVEFSAGFHPKPRISFDDPLPVGMESLHETCVVSARPGIFTQEMMEDSIRPFPKV